MFVMAAMSRVSAMRTVTRPGTCDDVGSGGMVMRVVLHAPDSVPLTREISG